ncbi:39S ribosomal protein L35, mitochondrial-like [Varroa jacobsoni]|uniref:39S ribosomal protein L35, mitochondrial-like n=1 Tax=Varroa jacobsoni TaxID=62625 RepID=UPI000BF4B626|nr:39S ribosomal protein L35, mitochondrial-like [Varroa jacobsoni]
MFRTVVSSLRLTRLAGSSLLNSGLAAQNPGNFLIPTQIALTEQTRTVIKFNHKDGSRDIDPIAIKSFYRLNCGLWIHAMPGRGVKRWKKTPAQLDKMRKHVFCKRYQCKVLDKMVKGEGGKYLAPKYLPDDIYEPYNNFKPPNLVYRPFH